MRTLLTLLLVVILLAIFNPDRDDFETFVREQAGEMIRNEVGEGGLGGALSNLGGNLAASQLARRFEYKNYYVFSTYTLDVPGSDENDWRFLGVATQFVELHRPASLTR